MILAGALVVTSLSLVECLVPIPPPLQDSEIEAEFRLGGVSCLQYPPGLALAAIAVQARAGGAELGAAADRPRA